MEAPSIRTESPPSLGVESATPGLLPLLILILALAGLFHPVSTPANPHPAGNTCCRSQAQLGWQALQGGHSDSALALFMQAYRQGMSRDSLFYFLAETALRKNSYDTAMAFNLSIPPAATAAPLREAVLDQRHKIYTLAGLQKDAARVRDSLTSSPAALARPGRKPGWSLALGSGFGQENHYAARLYPYGLDLGGFRSQGWLVRNQAQLLHPLPSSASAAWSVGLGYDLSKSFYKDSMDYRFRIQLRADEVLNHFGFGVSAQVGRISGTGMVTSGKAGASYLRFKEGVLTFVDMGYESEWEPGGRRRFEAGWISMYRDIGLAKGRRLAMTLAVSGVRMDPLQGAFPDDLLYVDDVTREQPTHYQDGSFQDTIPYTRFNKMAEFTQSAGRLDFPTLSPQNFLALFPGATFSFPLPLGLMAEAGGGFSLSLYPEHYAWEQASPLPSESQSFDLKFRGFALNQADGRIYTAAMTGENAQEFYSREPVRTVEKRRVDRQVHGSLGLKRRLGFLGFLNLDGVIKKNGSNLSDEAPLWIPSWEYGLSMKWSRSWH